jgi:hypothetical protein
MTFGKSKSVEEFLKAAKKDRTFSVIVVETGPDFEVCAPWARRVPALTPWLSSKRTRWRPCWRRRASTPR